MAGRRILGIDPGLHTTGYGIVDIGPPQLKVCEAGIISTAESKKETSIASRLLTLYNGIVEVVQEFGPEVIVVEQLYAHYKHPRTAILMAHARGTIFLAAAQLNLPVVSYNATRIKKIITGNGHAGKEQVQVTIQKEFGLKELPEPADVTDALAVALCHYHLTRKG